MAMIKVFDVKGSKQLQCFDTLDKVDYVRPMTEEEKTLLDAFLAFDDRDVEIE